MCTCVVCGATAVPLTFYRKKRRGSEKKRTRRDPGTCQLLFPQGLVTTSSSSETCFSPLLLSLPILSFRFRSLSYSPSFSYPPNGGNQVKIIDQYQTAESNSIRKTIQLFPLKQYLRDGTSISLNRVHGAYDYGIMSD